MAMCKRFTGRGNQPLNDTIKQNAVAFVDGDPHCGGLPFVESEWRLLNNKKVDDMIALKERFLEEALAAGSKGRNSAGIDSFATLTTSSTKG